MTSVPFFGPGGVLGILNVLGSREKSSFHEVISDPRLKIPADTLKLVLGDLIQQGFVGEAVHEGKKCYSLTKKAERFGPFNQIEGLAYGWFIGDETVKNKVLEGFEQITFATSNREIAEWYKGVMERLDALVDEGTRNLIMQNCGYYGCAGGNRSEIEKVIEERKKFRNIDDFLDHQVRKGGITREGNTLYQTYEPRKAGIRCWCSLVNSLPDDEIISPTYCQCGLGFAKKYWEDVLQRPVKVELVHSSMSGAKDCKFSIHMQI